MISPRKPAGNFSLGHYPAAMDAEHWLDEAARPRRMFWYDYTPPPGRHCLAEGDEAGVGRRFRECRAPLRFGRAVAAVVGFCCLTGTVLSGGRGSRGWIRTRALAA